MAEIPEFTESVEIAEVVRRVARRIASKNGDGIAPHRQTTLMNAFVSTQGKSLNLPLSSISHSTWNEFVKQGSTRKKTNTLIIQVAWFWFQSVNRYKLFLLEEIEKIDKKSGQETDNIISEVTSAIKMLTVAIPRNEKILDDVEGWYKMIAFWKGAYQEVGMLSCSGIKARFSARISLHGETKSFDGAIIPHEDGYLLLGYQWHVGSLFVMYVTRSPRSRSMRFADRGWILLKGAPSPSFIPCNIERVLDM